MHCACIGFVGIVWTLTSRSFCSYTWSWLLWIPDACFAPQVNNSCGMGWVVATLLCIYQKDDLNLRLLCSWGSIHQATKTTSGFFTLLLLQAMKYSSKEPRVRADSWTIQYQKFKFYFPYLNQRVQKLTNSPDDTLLITLSQSASLSVSSDFKIKRSIQKRKVNF